MQERSRSNTEDLDNAVRKLPGSTGKRPSQLSDRRPKISVDSATSEPVGPRRRKSVLQVVGWATSCSVNAVEVKPVDKRQAGPTETVRPTDIASSTANGIAAVAKIRTKWERRSHTVPSSASVDPTIQRTGFAVRDSRASFVKSAQGDGYGAKLFRCIDIIGGSKSGAYSGGNLAGGVPEESSKPRCSGPPLTIREIRTTTYHNIGVKTLRVKEADMPSSMQSHALCCALNASHRHNISCKQLAFALKKAFDKAYGPAWHCIVGSSFGSFVTHSRSAFLYFSVDKLYILLFKTAVHRLECNSNMEM